MNRLGDFAILLVAVVSGVLVLRSRENGNAVGGPNKRGRGAAQLLGTARKLRAQRARSRRGRTASTTGEVGSASSEDPGTGKDPTAEAPDSARGRLASTRVRESGSAFGAISIPNRGPNTVTRSWAGRQPNPDAARPTCFAGGGQGHWWSS